MNRNLNPEEFGLFAGVEEETGIFWEEEDVRRDFTRAVSQPDRASQAIAGRRRRYVGMDPEFGGLAPEHPQHYGGQGGALAAYLQDYPHRSRSN